MKFIKKETLANNFRKELIELLKKHNAELSLGSEEGGSVDLTFDIYDSSGEFLVTDAWLGSTTTANVVIRVEDIKETFQIEEAEVE